MFTESGFEGSRGSIADPLFETPYFVVSNVSSGVEPGVQDLDVSLLGSLGLDVAGVGGDETFRMSSSFRELCGGRVESCRAGDVYRRAYVQILYDRVRDDMRDEWASRAVRALAPSYRPGDLIESGSDYLGLGWSHEAWGSWMVESSAFVNLRVEDPGDGGLVIAARVRNGESVLLAEVEVNGQSLDTWVFRPAMPPHMRRVVIPADLVPGDGMLRITISTRSFASLPTSGSGEEARRLGIAVYGMRVCRQGAACDVPAS